MGCATGFVRVSAVRVYGAVDVCACDPGFVSVVSIYEALEVCASEPDVCRSARSCRSCLKALSCRASNSSLVFWLFMLTKRGVLLG